MLKRHKHFAGKQVPSASLLVFAASPAAKDPILRHIPGCMWVAQTPRGGTFQIRDTHERAMEVMQLQNTGQQKESWDEDAGEELGDGELLQAQVAESAEGESVPLEKAGRQAEPRVLGGWGVEQGASGYQAAPKRGPHSLLIGQPREIAPVHGEVLELEGVNSNEHQHGVSYH